MIEKDGRYYKMYCDGCNEKFEYSSYDFMDVIKEAKQSDWQIKKTGQEWEHYCPKCK